MLSNAILSLVSSIARVVSPSAPSPQSDQTGSLARSEHSVVSFDQTQSSKNKARQITGTINGIACPRNNGLIFFIECCSSIFALCYCSICMQCLSKLFFIHHLCLHIHDETSPRTRNQLGTINAQTIFVYPIPDPIP